MWMHYNLLLYVTFFAINALYSLESDYLVSCGAMFKLSQLMLLGDFVEESCVVDLWQVCTKVVDQIHLHVIAVERIFRRLLGT